MRAFSRIPHIGPWLLALALITTSGCAFITKHIGSIAASTKRITYQGTVAVLKNNPSERPKFVLAYDDLSKAIANGKIDSTLLVQITSTIPSKRLTGDIGSIAIEAGSLIMDLAAGDKIDLAKAPNVVEIATAIRDGIQQALLEIP